MCGVASNCLQDGGRLTTGGRHAPGYPMYFDFERVSPTVTTYYHATKLEWYVVNHSQSPPPPHTQDITHNSRHVLGSVTKQRVVIPRCNANELETDSPIPPHQQLRYSPLEAAVFGRTHRC